MSEARHIFLSYCSIEADFALKLAADLKNAGVNLWMDRLDGIRGGDDWRRQIEVALSSNQCAMMIAALSSTYLAASYCLNELARADRLKIPVLPVLLYPVPDMPIELERVQYIPFFDADKSGRLTRTWHEDTLYTERLRQLLKALPVAQTGHIPDAETQYLTSLIAELEARKGVLEYIELSTQADAPRSGDPIRPEPCREEEWAAGFALLLFSPRELPSERTVHEPSLHEASKKIALASIREAIEKHPRFVLIGEPGAGKTTAIRHLALDAARKRRENPHIAPIPLFLNLPEWGDEETPLDFVRKFWPLNTDPFGLMANGDILLYLDGLNEMGGKGTAKAKQLREWFAQPKAPKHVIVTCRARDYENKELKLGEIPRVLVEELDETKIRQFAGNYLHQKANGFLAHILPVNQDAREDVHSLFRLARNPYLLAALIFIYQNAPDGDLPHNNGVLMQALARALWERERQKQTQGWIPFNEMEKQFGKLAFKMLEKHEPVDMPIEYASSYIDNDALLKIGYSANLVEIQGKEFRFYHQLMQEYLAAAYVEHMGGLTYLLQVVNSDSEAGSITFKIGDWEFGQRYSYWDEVVIAICGITHDSDATVRQLIEVDDLLAAYCVQSGIAVENRTIQILVDRLMWGLQSVDGLEETVDAFLKLDKSIVVERLLYALENPEMFWDNAETDTTAEAIYILGDIGSPAAVPKLIQFLEDTTETEYINSLGERRRICEIASEALTHIGTQEALVAVEESRRERNQE